MGFYFLGINKNPTRCKNLDFINELDQKGTLWFI